MTAAFTVGRPTAVRAVLALLLAAVIAVLAAPTASAHASLRSTDPAQGSVLAVAPAQVTWTFSEPIGPAAETFELYGPDGFRASVPAMGLDEVVTALLPSDLPQGTFQLDWRVISVDSHPLAGTLTFSIGAASALPDRAAAPGDDPGVALVFRIAQFLAYLGLITVIGVALFGVLVQRQVRRPGSRNLGRLSAVAAVLAVLGHLLLVPLTYFRQQGLSLGSLGDVRAWGSEFGTDQGLALALVLVGTSLILWSSVRQAAATGSTSTARILTLVGVVVAAVSVTIVGHTRGPKSNPLMVASDLVHVAAASVWFGGLIALIVALRQAFARRGEPAASSAEETAALVARFSVLAGWTVLALGVSGGVMAFTVLDSWDSLLHTGYGQSLLVKIAVVIAAVLVAWWNRARLVPVISGASAGAVPGEATGLPGAAGSPDTAVLPGTAVLPDTAVLPASAWRRLRVLLLTEVGLLTVVVAVTALLVSLSPVADTGGTPPAALPGVDTGSSVVAPNPEFFEFDSPLGTGSVTGRLGPVAVGLNTLRFTLRDAEGSAVDPLAVPEMTLVPTGGGGAEVLVQPRYADVVGEFAADVRIPATGEWTLELEVVMVDATASAAVEFTVD